MSEPVKFRRLRFNLRGVLAVVASAAVVCSIAAPYIREYLWPPESGAEADFDELIKLIQETVKPTTGRVEDTQLELQID